MEPIRAVEAVKLEDALGEFYSAMLGRLEAKLAEGYTGWDDENAVTDAALAGALSRDADTVQDNIWGGEVFAALPRLYLDIANRAMMLWWREQRRVGGPA